MWETIKKEFLARISIALFFFLSAWWFLSPVIAKRDYGGERFIGDFASVYFLVALVGAFSGFYITQLWGGVKSVMGKAIIFFSLGLFGQVFGQIAYAYYAFFKPGISPYPSIGDLGYFGSIPCYILGVIFLARASGVHIKLKQVESKIQAIILPLFVLGVGYYLFLRGYEFDFSGSDFWTVFARTFLDFGYPLGQAVYISMAILTYLFSRGVLGGMMKGRILFILIALSLQFVCDYLFIYQSIHSAPLITSMYDYLYLVSYLTMTLALIELKGVLSRI